MYVYYLYIFHIYHSKIMRPPTYTEKDVVVMLTHILQIFQEVFIW